MRFLIKNLWQKYFGYIWFSCVVVSLARSRIKLLLLTVILYINIIKLVQGVEFKSAHFLIFLRNCIKWDSIKIFNPKNKQNGAMEQISTFYLKFMPSASDPTLIQPACRPWWTWPEIIKFAGEYAVVHYSKSPCPKNTRKFWSNFFSL